MYLYIIMHIVRRVYYKEDTHDSVPAAGSRTDVIFVVEKHSCQNLRAHKIARDRIRSSLVDHNDLILFFLSKIYLLNTLDLY